MAASQVECSLQGFFQEVVEVVEDHRQSPAAEEEEGAVVERAFRLGLRRLKLPTARSCYKPVGIVIGMSLTERKMAYSKSEMMRKRYEVDAFSKASSIAGG